MRVKRILGLVINEKDIHEAALLLLTAALCGGKGLNQSK